MKLVLKRTVSNEFFEYPKLMFSLMCKKIMGHYHFNIHFPLSGPMPNWLQKQQPYGQLS